MIIIYAEYRICTCESQGHGLALRCITTLPTRLTPLEGIEPSYPREPVLKTGELPLLNNGLVGYPGFEPRFTRSKRVVIARLYQYPSMRDMGIEPISSAWKADILTSIPISLIWRERIELSSSGPRPPALPICYNHKPIGRIELPSQVYKTCILPLNYTGMFFRNNN